MHLENILITMNDNGDLVCQDNNGGYIEEMNAKRLVITLNDFFRSSVISYFTISFEPYGLGKKIVTDNIYKDGISQELFYSSQNGTLVCPIFDYVSVSPKVRIQIDGYETDSNSDVCAIYKSGIMELNFSDSLVGEKIIPDSTNADLRLSERISNIMEEEISSLVIGENNITSSAVTTPKIADGAVTNTKIADGAVRTVQILDRAVTKDKIGDNAVRSNHIYSSAVTSEKLDSSAVTTGKIADSAVTNTKIADGAVRTSQLLDNAVTSAKLGDSSVKTVKIANGAVTDEKLASESVTTGKIANSAVTNTKIAEGAVRTVQLLDNAVTSAKIADSAVRTNHINDGVVTTEKIAGNAVTTGKIADSAVTNVKIADNAVRRNHILDDAVSGRKILDGCITNSKLADNSVTNEKLDTKIQAIIKKNPSFIVVDKQINFIAYSHTNSNGCTINTQNEYIYNCTHGYTSIKGDMRLTSDGKIIMCHDDGFTFDQNGKITTYDSNNAQLILNNTYDYWMSKQYADGSSVCDFDTFIKICKTYGKTPFITLRQENTLVTDPDDNEQKAAYIVNIKKMLEILEKYHMRENCIVNSTNYTPLWELRHNFDASIPMAFSYGKITESDNKLRIDQASNVNQLRGDCIVIGGINNDISNLDHTFDDGDGNMVTAMEYAQRKGVRFYCYFITSTQDALAAIDKGVTGMQMTCAVPIETQVMTIPVEDVEVNGTSVVSNSVAQVTVPTKTSDLTNDSGFLTSHQDISGKANVSDIPTALSDLTDDSTHRTVTDSEKATWSAKADAGTVVGYLAQKENVSNKVTSIDTSSPSNSEYPSESAVVTYVSGLVGNINTILDTINGEVI